MALDHRLARLVARGLAKTPVTPNMVTGTVLVCGLGAAWLLSRGGTMADWGAGLFVIAVWMDHLDGELARMLDRTSEFGHYFDHASAMTAYAGMFIGAGLGERAGWLGPWAPAAGVAAALSVVAIFTVRIGVENRRGREAVAQTVIGGFEMEDFLYVVAPLVWLDLTAPMLVTAGIVTPLFLVWVVWDETRHKA